MVLIRIYILSKIIKRIFITRRIKRIGSTETGQEASFVGRRIQQARAQARLGRRRSGPSTRNTEQLFKSVRS